MRTVTFNPPTVKPKCKCEDSTYADCLEDPCDYRLSEIQRPLNFTDCLQWLEVTCERCGPLASGDQDETEEAEKIQRCHSEKFRGHRVNVELFFRTAVSTRINDTPKEPEFDPQFIRN